MLSLVTRSFAVALLAISVMSVGQGRAGTIPIVNGSFETPVVGNELTGSFTGWTVSGTAGIQRPAAYGNLLPAYDGAQDAWLHAGGSIEQTVGSYESGSSYTLTYHAGEWTSSGQYEVSLLVGNTVLASYTSPGIAPYIWDTVTTLVAAPNPSLSGLLTIEFAYASGYETDIDAVSLTASSAVPEPSSLVLAAVAALAGLSLWARRRNVSVR